MITAEIYAHVLPAVRLLLDDNINTAEDAPPIEQQVHTRLWAYVTHAVHDITHPSAPEAEAPKQDGRSKVWQYVVRFYINAGTASSELIAETDIETIKGTGKLPDIIEKYAAEMHPDDATFPSVLVASAIKDQRLPQLRNNLGRYDKAQLRFEYVIEGVNYGCVVDVTKPGA